MTDPWQSGASAWPTDEDATRAGTIPPLWRRVVARLFDEIVLALPRLALTLPYTTFGGSEGVVYDPPKWALAVSVLLPFVYDLVFVMAMSATPGKRLLGMTVCASSDRGEVSATQASMRALVPIVGSALALATTSADLAALLTLATPVIYASVSWDRLRRGLHDKAAGTIVVYR